MRRLIISSILLITLVGIGWHYTPQRVRERLLGFVGVAARGDADGVKKAIGDLVLPKDPEERRRVLIGELKKNVDELKRRAIPGVEAETGAPVIRQSEAAEGAQAESAEAIIGNTEKLLGELAESNGDKSVGGTIVERIVERILPAAQCRE